MMSPVLLLQLSVLLPWINGSLAWRHSSMSNHDQSDDANAATDDSPVWAEFESTMKQAEKNNKIDLAKAKDGMNIFHELFEDKEIQDAATAADLVQVMKDLSSNANAGDDEINKIMETESMKKLNSLMQGKLKAGEWEKLEGAFSDVLDTAAKIVTISGIPDGKALEGAGIDSNRTKLNLVLEQSPEGLCISGRPTYWGGEGSNRVLLYYCGKFKKYALTKEDTLADLQKADQDCKAILQFSGNVQDDSLKLFSIETGDGHGHKWLENPPFMDQVKITVESDPVKFATECKK